MAEIIKRLTKNEKEFVEFWKTIKKSRITGGELDKASKLLSVGRTGSCSSCMRNDAKMLNRRFMSLLNIYNEEKEMEKNIPIEKEPLPEGFGEPEFIGPPVEEPKKETKKIVPKKKSVPKKRTYKKKEIKK